jgi:hypothetical protein
MSTSLTPDDCAQRINDLSNKMSMIEDEIAYETEILKENYIKASSAMKETQHYVLTGIKTDQPTKSYLLTGRGVEVIGEDVLPISNFIDSVLRFANYPKRKIEVLKDLVKHLQNVTQMIEVNSSSL